jgi:cytochrome P450
VSTEPFPIRPDYNPFIPAHKRDPFPFYAEARKHTPIFFSPILNMFVITRHEDIVAITGDPARFSSMQSLEMPPDTPPEVFGILSQGHPLVPALINNDPPSHTRIRGLCNKAFTPSRVAAMEGRMRATANMLVDQFAAAGKADIMGQFAFPLPQIVIADIVGVPREDIQKFVGWGAEWAAMQFEKLPPDAQIQAAHSAVAFQQYNADMVEARRANPQDDLMSGLVHAQIDGEARLSTVEIISIVTTLLIAGHMTTSHLIGDALAVLTQHPDHMAALYRDPSNTAAGLVEEILRLETPAPGLFRTTTEDVTMNGVTMPKGARLYLLYASANRDESVFPDPDRFDPARPNLGNHLAFSRGIHYCLGAPLARLEGKVALEVLAARLPNMRMAAGQELDYTLNLSFRGPNALVLEWDV